MSFKKRFISYLMLAVCLGAVCWVCLSVFSVPTLNLTSPMGGRLPVLSLQWDGNTLRPTDNSGNINLPAASVTLDFPNMDTSVIAPAEEFLSGQVTAEGLKRLMPQGHRLYGLLEFHGNYWLITGKQTSSLYLVAVGSFHQREEPEHTPVKYRDFYKRKLAYMRGSGSSMSSAY